MSLATMLLTSTCQVIKVIGSLLSRMSAIFACLAVIIRSIILWEECMSIVEHNPTGEIMVRNLAIVAATIYTVEYKKKQYPTLNFPFAIALGRHLHHECVRYQRHQRRLAPLDGSASLTGMQSPSGPFGSASLTGMQSLSGPLSIDACKQLHSLGHLLRGGCTGGLGNQGTCPQQYGYTVCQHQDATQSTSGTGVHLRGGGDPGQAGGGKGAKNRKKAEGALLTALAQVLTQFAEESPLTPNPPATKNERKKRSKHNQDGLLEALQRLVTRTQTQGSQGLLGRLSSLVKSAEAGHFDGNGNSKTKPAQVNEREARPQSETSPQPRSHPNGKGRGGKSTVVERGKPWGDFTAVPRPTEGATAPRTLQAQHWKGTIVTKEQLFNNPMPLQTGHYVTGVLDAWHSDLEQLVCTNDSSITLVFSKEVKDAMPVRVPATDKKGISKLHNLWYKQIGQQANPVTWTKLTKSAADVAAPQDSVVLQLQVCKGHIDNKLWGEIIQSPRARSKYFTDSLLSMGVTKAELIDVFNPGRASDIEGAPCVGRARVAVAVKQKLLVRSGEGGLLLRELVITTPCAVNWLSRFTDESDQAYLLRAIAQSALQPVEYQGVCFSASGSLGIKCPPGSLPTMWKTMGWPLHATHGFAENILTKLGWTNISMRERRARREDATYIVKAVPPPDSLFCSVTDVVLASGTMTLEAEPWTPSKKPKPPVTSRSVPLSHFVAPSRERPNTASPSKVEVSDFKDGEVLNTENSGESPHKKSRDSDGVALVGTVNHQIEKLALRADRVPGKGQCFFNSLSVLFKAINKEDKSLKLPEDPQLLRNLTIAEMDRLQDKIRPSWDGLDSTGTTNMTWPEYIAHMKLSTSWAGEHEILAAASKWKLRLAIIRPGLETVSLGHDKRLCWLKLHASHFEPLLPTSTSSTDAAARQAHEKAVPKDFRFTLNSATKKRSWTIGKAGGSFDAASSLSGTRKSARSITTAKSKGRWDKASSLPASFRTKLSKAHSIDDALSVLSAGSNSKSNIGTKPATSTATPPLKVERGTVARRPAAFVQSSLPSGSASCIPNGIASSVMKKPAKQAYYCHAPRKRDLYELEHERSLNFPNGCSKHNKEYIRVNPSAKLGVENAAKTRASAAKIKWLCSPELVGKLGVDEQPWKCSKCDRCGSHPNRLYNPQACMPCSSYKGKDRATLTACRRRDVLIGLGVMGGVIANKAKLAADPAVSAYLEEYKSRPRVSDFCCSEPGCDYVLSSDICYFSAKRREHLALHGIRSCRKDQANQMIDPIARARILAGTHAKSRLRHNMWNERKPAWACEFSPVEGYQGTKKKATPVHCCHCKRTQLSSVFIRTGCPHLVHLYPDWAFGKRTGASTWSMRKKYLPATFSNGQPRDPLTKLSVKGRLRMTNLLHKLWFSIGAEADEVYKADQNSRKAARRLAFKLGDSLSNASKKRRC